MEFRVGSPFEDAVEESSEEGDSKLILGGGGGGLKVDSVSTEVESHNLTFDSFRWQMHSKQSSSSLEGVEVKVGLVSSPSLQRLEG